MVQERPSGLCDALFRAMQVMRDDEEVLIGLPDTVWFPLGGFSLLPQHELSFLLFPVDEPHRFDAVLTVDGVVTEIQVVNDREVVSRHSEPQLALLVGAHDPVVGVVEDDLEAQAARPRRGAEARRISWRPQPAADFRGQHVLTRRPVAKTSSGAQLRKPAPIPGRGVEVPDAGVPRRAKTGERVLFGDVDEQLADGRAAEAHLREPHVRPPELSGVRGIH